VEERAVPTRIALYCIPFAAAVILAGFRVVGVTLLVASLAALEVLWWRAHPDFERSLSARWAESLEFYGEEHQHPMNRLLHVLGIPFVWFGSLTTIFGPLHDEVWCVGFVAFCIGWLFNGIGHVVFEGPGPAYEEGTCDALSVFSSVAWDLAELPATVAASRAWVRSALRGDVVDGAAR
jgi:hypothetical protein